LPYIGKTQEYDNVIVAGGHAMLGISQGTGTGLLVSQLVSEASPEIAITAFGLNRF
jgi:D-amino-acid dehydrogenase